MLSDIHKRLEIDGEIEPDFVQNAILTENTWGLSWRYAGYLSAEEREEYPPVVREVCDILDMWTFIEVSYEQLSDDEKDSLHRALAPFKEPPKFPGFDGNNENEHMGVAQFLINDLKRFERFDANNLNSHMPSLDKHNRMLNAFKNIRREMSHGIMNLEQLETVLRERIHPEMRD